MLDNHHNELVKLEGLVLDGGYDNDAVSYERGEKDENVVDSPSVSQAVILNAIRLRIVCII